MLIRGFGLALARSPDDCRAHAMLDRRRVSRIVPGLLRGGDGSDNLSGNGGSDTLDGQLGADNLTGGDGTGIDRVIYPRFNAVTVTIDDVANDGELGEGDNVRSDNEQVEGSIAGDSLTGSDRDETL